jgi:hypothetical protein
MLDMNLLDKREISSAGSLRLCTLLNLPSLSLHPRLAIRQFGVKAQAKLKPGVLSVPVQLRGGNEVDREGVTERI